MKRKIIVFILLLLGLSMPLLAVFNEKDLKQTLNVLRFELKQEMDQLSVWDTTMTDKSRAQRKMMVEMIKRCNELSLMLYSQRQENTFDLTYALKEVTQTYDDFNKTKMPYDEILSALDVEIERYSRLVESLRRLPPQMEEVMDVPDSVRYKNDTIDIVDAKIIEHTSEDETRQAVSNNGNNAENPVNRILNFVIKQQDQTPFMLEGASLEDRDSCLYYAVNILKYYLGSKERFSTDNQHYEDISTKLKESYDYAQTRYKVVQKSIFIKGGNSYFKVLKRFPMYMRKVVSDFSKKYDTPEASEGELFSSEWKGPMIMVFILFVFSLLFLSILCSRFLFGVLERNNVKFQSEKYSGKKKYIVFLSGSLLFVIIISALCFITRNHFISVSGELILPFAWLVSAILLSIIIRLDTGTISAGMKIYVPVIWMGIIVLLCRLAFVPNSFINLVLPPLLLFFLIWQYAVNMKYNDSMQSTEKVVNIISLAVMLASTILALLGFVFMSIQIFVWWLFQMSMLLSIVAVVDIIHAYQEVYYKKVLPLDKKSHYDEAKLKKGDYIHVTWMFDFVNMTVVPISAILSFLLSLWYALKLFDMKEFYHILMNTPFFNLTDAEGNSILDVTAKVLVVVFCMFFLFRFFNYAVKALFKAIKYASIMRKSGAVHIRDNQVNLTLANNVISILVWGTYIITVVWMLKIPTGAISIIAAGLATGLGLAMKDILNNAVYGIQLMSGRLRVGDYIECNDVRGKVTDISYQSTQIETLEGAVISFLNADLLSNKFKNLTRNNSYEFLKIVVGVNYGADVQKVRELLLKSLPSINYKDKYGRDVLDAKKGYVIAFDSFGDNSVNIALRVYVLVAERSTYLSKAQELIYNILNANGIEIPFPQRDVYVRMLESKE